MVGQTGVDSEFEFPSELLIQPQILVGVTGLDVLNNAVHRTIWDALTNSRAQDRPPVQFKQLTPSHHLPRPKLKRGQYEMHIPKGILKRNWMVKHLTVIPAVVVVFYDLDWDDQHWDQRELECTSRVQSIKLALEGRSSRVCVVLIQHKSPLPSGEDELAADRASSLFKAADLSSKSLFILPHTDNLHGYTARLEKAFFELALSYYQHEIRQIKAHREHLNKKTHQYLYVRHQFKMGFLSELRQDLMTAHSCYSEAYSQLLEVRVSDTNEFEVKTIAGYIVYKVCRMLFLAPRPRDAISQFKAHVEHYRHRTGPPQLLFQHHAWLAKQFSVFAELFEEMVEQGSPAVQTQHPGYYYQLAAKHASDRRNVAVQLCSDAQSYPAPDPLAGIETLEFYGQRPWRPCKLSAEPLDPDKERQAIQALQYIEMHSVCHSDIIIGLLGNAISQFKTYRCLRMRRHLVVQMAEEYFSSKDYGKALTLLTHMLWDYRAERWGKILDSLLVIAMNCAYLTASLPEYVSLCIEVASRLSPHSSKAINNLLAITKALDPEAEASLSEIQVSKATDLWRKTRNEEGSVTIDMANLCTGIHCKAAILKASYNSMTVQVMIKFEMNENMTFSKLSACVNTGTTVSEYPLVTADERLSLAPGSVVEFICDLVPHSLDVGKIVQISSVLLYLGNSTSATGGRAIVLKFNGQDSESLTTYPELLYFRHVSKDVARFEAMKPVLNREVARRTPRLVVDVVHSSPALLAEWYPLTIVMTSDETIDINQPTLTVLLNSTALETSTEFRCKESGDLVSLPMTLSLPLTLSPNDRVSRSFYMRGSSLGLRHFDIKVVYEVNGEMCIKEANVDVDVVEVFSISGQYLTMKFEELPQCLYSAEPFLLRTQIVSVSPWPVTILSTSLQLGEGVHQEGEYKCVLGGTTLSQGERGTCVTCLTTSKPSQTPVHVMSFVISWCRCWGEEDEQERTEWKRSDRVEAMPEMKTVESVISVNLEVPDSLARVRSLLPISYAITNTTTRLYTVQLNMDASDAFMFSGHTQAVLHILPESTRRVDYKLYPLYCGLVKLPKIKLTSLVDCLPQATLTHVIERSLPTSLYVLPQAKGIEMAQFNEANETPVA